MTLIIKFKFSTSLTQLDLTHSWKLLNKKYCRVSCNSLEFVKIWRRHERSTFVFYHVYHSRFDLHK